MAQDTNFKDSILLVNSNLIGILNRTGLHGQKGNAQLNYALRPTWGIIDKLRGILGAYYAEHTADGLNLVSLAPDSPDLGTLSVAQQVQSIPLIVTQIPANNGIIKYLIELDNAAWNALAFEDSSLDLLRQNIEESGVAEGDPMWEYFLKLGIPGEELADPPLPTAIPPVFDRSQTFLDLTSFYYRANDDDAIREKSGLTIKIDPIYNFYVDTTPTYESISMNASEPMLPNFYCLESEIRNTGSTLNSADYFNQITLDGKLQEVNIDNDAQPDPWFQQVAGPAGGFTESKTTQFYTLYSKGLNILKGNGDIEGLKGVFNENYKNIVILNSDLAAMSEFVIRDDKTTGLRNMTFYNKITIGKDDNNVSDPSDLFNGSSFFSLMMGDPDFENSDSFMDILQLYIIQNILGNSGTASSFKAKRIKRGSPTDPTVKSVSVDAESPQLYFDMDTFLDDIVNENRIGQIINRINTNTTTTDNFILIRNYNSETSLTTASEVATDNFLLLNEDDRLNYPVRDFDKILKNKISYSEPIMYKIDKYVLAPGTSAGASNKPAPGSVPVQTFFIGKSFENKDINYIDSQVKYGVRYYYDIKQIRMVFGTKYAYKDLKVFFSAVAGYGRAFGNALGFYREPRPDVKLDDYISEFVKEYISTDSDTTQSQVVPDGTGNEPSGLTSYYIFKADNYDAFLGGPNLAIFDELFAAGTGFVHKNPMADNATEQDREILRNINLEIKEGFGLEGNASGGADSGVLDIVVAPSPTVTLGTGDEVPLPSETPSALPGETGTYGGTGLAGAAQSQTPIAGTGPSMNTGQLGAPDPDLLNLFGSGN